MATAPLPDGGRKGADRPTWGSTFRRVVNVSLATVATAPGPAGGRQGADRPTLRLDL